MAITIRDIEQHYYMIEDLKSLTKSNVTTKALIKGGYMAVELGKMLEEEKANVKKLEQELADLKDIISTQLQLQQRMKAAVK